MLRQEKVAALRDGGVSLVRKVTSYDVRRGEVTSETGNEAWLSGRAWVATAVGERQDTQVEWWSEQGNRGHMALALGLARSRAQIAKEDRTGYPDFLADHSLVSLADSFGHLQASVKEAGDGRIVLELVTPNDNSSSRSRYLIDTTRHVLLEVAHSMDGKPTSTEVYSDFIEVAGCWWARRVEYRNGEGKPSTLVEIKVLPRNETEFRAGFDRMLEPRAMVLFIDGDLPAVAAAKSLVLAGKNTLESDFALLNHFADSQQWERVNTQFEAIRKHAAGKPGLQVLATRLLTMQRRNEEARTLVVDAAKALAAAPGEDELFLADRLRGEANPVASAAEQHELLQILKPIYERAPKHLLALRDWNQALVSNYQTLSRIPEAVELAAKLARDYDWDPNAQTQFANLLANSGDVESGLAWLNTRIENKDQRWIAAEIAGFRMSYVNLAESNNRLEEVLRAVEAGLREKASEPSGTWLHSRWLAAMIRLGKTDEAYAQIDAWLAEGVARKGEAFDMQTRNRLGAAIEVLTGRGYGVQPNDIPERFHRGLAKVVRTFALSAKDASFAESIMGDYRFTRTEQVRTLRKHFAQVLEKRAATLDVAAVNCLLGWLGTNCERLYLMARLQQDAGKIAGECWEYLGTQNPFAEGAKVERPWQRAVLIERHLATLEYLAAQPTAEPAMVKQLLDWLARGIAAQPDEPKWKQHLHRLLVVLDRPAELKAALLEWTQRESETRNSWRIALGYLRAELAEIADAVRDFEAVEKKDELGPAEYRAMANWYLVLNRQTDSTRATVAQYGAMDEWSLANRIQQHASKIQQGFNNGTPEDFDPAVVAMFRAIFRKSQNPGQHIYQLGTLYRYTKDFRLLECLADGVVGNSEGQIYSFLGSMNGVLPYVNDEAVCDQILAHLAEVSKGVKTRVDARGLDLLEVLVRRKAAEVLNQPGQQVPLALAAMRRAFAGDEWGIGERRLMAQLLAGLGTISQEPLAAEQRNELQALDRASEAGTPDRMHIGASWAGVIRGYGDAQQAVDVLGAAIQEYRATQGGLLTPEAQAPFDQWIGYHEADRHFASGEKAVTAALDMKVLESVRQWLVERKYRLYGNTLAAGGSVSLGQGRELFDHARKSLTDELGTRQLTHRGQLCAILIEMFRTAHFQAKLKDVAADLVEFAGGPFDQRVPFQTTNYQSLVQGLGSALREIAGDRAALAFLITRCEREPASFRATGQGGWSRYGYQMAEYRSRVKDLGDLEARLLKLVLEELRRDLETGSFSNRYFYHDEHSYFWSEKRADFLALAMAVSQEKRASVVVVKFVADYLFDGLEAHEQAVEALTSAYGRKLLDEGGISQLAAFLERMNQDAAAVSRRSRRRPAPS